MEEMEIEFEGKDLFVLFQPGVSYDELGNSFFYANVENVFEIDYGTDKDKELDLNENDFNDLENIVSEVYNNRRQSDYE